MLPLISRIMLSCDEPKLSRLMLPYQTIVTEQNLIEFDLRQAIQLERKETNTAAAEKNAG